MSGMAALAAGIVLGVWAAPGPGWWGGGALLIGMMLWRWPQWRLPMMCLLAGMVWGNVAVQRGLAGWLPVALAGADITVTGTVQDLPVRQGLGPGRERWRFVLRVESSPHWPGQHLVRLNWYDAPQPLAAGDHLQLRVRLQAPRGQVNEGSSDSARLDLARGIDAAGTVRALIEHQPASAGLGPLREAIGQRLTGTLGQTRPAGRVLPALVTADRRALTDGDWQLLQQTGTAHLMAISGLHITLVAGLVWWLVRVALTPWAGGWRLTPAQWAVWPALLAAVGYAALAGFALPTRRACLMSLVALLAIRWRLRWRTGTALLCAALMVLLPDPLAALDNGFWLSFGAVAMLVWLAQGGETSLWRVQWLLSFGLGAFSAWLFSAWGLAAPLANLVAVPLFSLWVVPLTLAGTLVPGAQALWWGAALLVDLCWQGLAYLAAWQPLLPPPASLAAALAVLLACLLVCRPPGPWPRWWVPLLLLPWCWPAGPQLAEGDFDLVVFDVGQGQALAIRTRQQLVLYDLGPGWAGGNAGERVLRPWLLKQRRPVTLAFISHGDSDHAGGLPGLDGLLPARGVYSSAQQAPDGILRCLRGQHWTLDGVSLEVLWPTPALPLVQRNNRSCVVRVRGRGGTVLLTGDITRPVEYWLAARGDLSPVTVLQVPHHGSATSSSYALLRATQPRWAFASAGHANRFGHPAQNVRARYAALGVPLLVSSETGMIVFSLHGSHNPAPLLWRARYPRPWRPQAASTQHTP
jgi:competence protein ComEC